jgi:DNA-binding PucR family transcriptional regulator
MKKNPNRTLVDSLIERIRADHGRLTEMEYPVAISSELIEKMLWFHKNKPYHNSIDLFPEWTLNLRTSILIAYNNELDLRLNAERMRSPSNLGQYLPYKLDWAAFLNIVDLTPDERTWIAKLQDEASHRCDVLKRTSKALELLRSFRGSEEELLLLFPGTQSILREQPKRTRKISQARKDVLLQGDWTPLMQWIGQKVLELEK